MHIKTAISIPLKVLIIRYSELNFNAFTQLRRFMLNILNDLHYENKNGKK